MKGNEECSDSPDGASWRARRCKRDTTATCRPWRGLVALLAPAAIALAACTGSGSPSSAGSSTVASLGTSTGNGGGNESPTTTGAGSSANAPQAGNPTQSLNEWAACMRRHGDPDQADPTVDANKVIHITMLPSVPGGLLGPNGQSGPGPVPGSYCQAYLMGAITALQGNQQYELPSQAALVRYAECMRANGVADFPDPGGGLQLPHSPGSDLDPNNPVFQHAAEVCRNKTGVDGPGGGGPLPPGTVVSGPPGQPGMPSLIYLSSGGPDAHG